MYQINKLHEPIAELHTLADVLVFLNKSSPSMIAELDQLEVFKNGSPMTMTKNSYGKLGVIQPGQTSTANLLLEMLNEVDVRYIRPLTVVRQPHEMLPYEWHAFVALGSAAFNVYPCLTPDQRSQQLIVERDGKPVRVSIDGFMLHHMYIRFGFQNNGPLYGRKKESNGRHEVHVAYALAEGKEVPPDVIAWYLHNQSERGNYDVCGWFGLLLKHPEYRGKMTSDKLHFLHAILRKEMIGQFGEMTSKSAPYFIQLMAEVQDDASWTEIDDHLYGKGLLKLREPALQSTPPLLDQAHSPFALKLRERLGEQRKLDSIKYAHEQQLKYHHSLRELHERLKAAEELPAVESILFPNRIAKALDTRDVGTLLCFLDTSDGENAVTKKAVQEDFGLKLNGLKSEQRRNAIFDFCGYDAEKRAQYEKAISDKLAAKQQAEEVERNTQAAQATKVNFNGIVMTGAEYVDRSVSDGYTLISPVKKGASTQYWLSNPQNGLSVSLKKNNGTLDYARMKLEQQNILLAA